MTWSRSSRQSRGYGAFWQRQRALALARDLHLCQCERCKGGQLRVTPANQVDHRIPKAQGGTDDLDNLRSVNAKCHQRITLEQQGKKPKPRYDRNGRRLPDTPGGAV